MARSKSVTLVVQPGALTLKAQSLSISLTRTTIRAGEKVGLLYYFLYDSATSGVEGLPDTISVPLKIYVNGSLAKQVEANLYLTGVGYAPPGNAEVDLSFSKPGTYQIWYEVPDTVTITPSSGTESYGSIRSSSITLTVSGAEEKRSKGVAVSPLYLLALGLAGASLAGIVGYMVYHELKRPGGRTPF